MHSLITTLDPSPATGQPKTILAHAGFTCALITLDAGDETPRRDAAPLDEHILYVIEGRATIRLDGVNTILEQDQAQHIAPGRAPVISANAGGPVRLLRVVVPPRPVVAPQIITLNS